jgi:hypothetical protein
VVDELKTEEVKGMAKGMRTVEKLVQMLNDRSSKLTIGLEDLAALVQILKRNGGITSTDLTESRNSVLNQVREAIQPFIKLVRRLSSSKEDPGGLLMKRVMDLERTVVKLRATKADTTSLGKTTSWKDPPAPASDNILEGFSGTSINPESFLEFEYQTRYDWSHRNQRAKPRRTGYPRNSTQSTRPRAKDS